MQRHIQDEWEERDLELQFRAKQPAPTAGRKRPDKPRRSGSPQSINGIHRRRGKRMTW